MLTGLYLYINGKFDFTDKPFFEDIEGKDYGLIFLEHF